jgi:DNA-binding beta-propeller fold protein YncE
MAIARSTVLALLALLVHTGSAAAPDSRAFVTTTDYTSGGLRRIDLGTRTVLAGEASVSADTRVRWHNGRVVVINRFGQDNIQIVDPATLATVHQFSTGNGSNPADIAFAGGKAYITRYELASVLIMNPETGATLGTIPLGAFADADGIPEMDRMERVGTRLLISCQRLDRNNNFQPTASSVIVVVDTQADTVMDADPLVAGTQAITLTGRNPVTPFAFDVASGRLLIGCVGRFGMLDGGIEWIDPVQMKSLGWAISEGALGGEIDALAWNGAARSYAIVHDAGFNTELVSWSASSGTRLGTLDSPGGFSLLDLALDDRGELYVTNGSFTAPGVSVFDAGPDTLLAGPLDTGLPPGQITFDHATTDAASVAPGRPRLALSAPSPTPSRTGVRLTLELEREAAVEFALFDVAGRAVRSAVREIRPAGRTQFAWNLRSDAGTRVDPGVYLLRVSCAGSRVTRRIVVVR